MVLPWEEAQSASGSSGRRATGYKALKPTNPIDFANLDIESYKREIRNSFRNKPFAEDGGQTIEASEYVDTDFDFYEKHLVVETLGHEIEFFPSDLMDCQEKELIDSKLVKNNIDHLKFSKLNPLQTRSLPIIIGGHHLLVMAPTGIGKTAAFLLPAIQKVINWRKEELIPETSKPAPSVLVLNNTRNLAMQSFHRASLLLGNNGSNEVGVALHCYTSASARVNSKCDIAIATMGKLIDKIEKEFISLENLRLLIVDEADKMVAMDSFGADIENVYDKLPDATKERLQVCFFSATYDNDGNGLHLTELQKKLMRNENPCGIIVPPRPGHITQHIYRISEMDRQNPTIEKCDLVQKMNLARHLIDQDLKRTGCSKQGPFTETIGIFCETVKKVNVVTALLCSAGYKFAPLSSFIDKAVQSKTLEDLGKKVIQGVVCTNIISRGIDISSLKHIIILEMAKDFDTYRHRIGRTGRAGHGGTASVVINLDYYMGTEQRILEQLEEFLRQNRQRIPRWLHDFAENYRNQRRRTQHRHNKTDKSAIRLKWPKIAITKNL